MNGSHLHHSLAPWEHLDHKTTLKLHMTTCEQGVVFSSSHSISMDITLFAFEITFLKDKSDQTDICF